MVVVVAVMVVMVMVGTGVLAGRPALTGRRCRHSTTGLTVVSAAILPLAQLDQVVRNRHAQLRGEGWRRRCSSSKGRLRGWAWGGAGGQDRTPGGVYDRTPRTAEFALIRPALSSGAHTWSTSGPLAWVGCAPSGGGPMRTAKGKGQAKLGPGPLTAREVGWFTGRTGSPGATPGCSTAAPWSTGLRGHTQHAREG